MRETNTRRGTVSHKDELGGRMKAYEAVSQLTLPRRSYVVIRVDGRSFHTYLKSAGKPFDSRVTDTMGCVTSALCREIAGARFAYQQSDEISVLVTDFDSIESTPWFGNNVQKLASVAASVATASFNKYIPWAELRDDYATFDARAFIIPDPVEVANYFVWRQKDAQRNALSAVAHRHFTNRELHGMNSVDQRVNLRVRKGILFDMEYDGRNRNGVVAYKTDLPRFDVSMVPEIWQVTNGVQSVRRWVQSEAPQFVADNVGFLADQIPEVPRLWAED